MAFQVEVSQIEANYKLSQNRKDEDYWNIVSKLEAREDELSHGVAEAMKKPILVEYDRTYCPVIFKRPGVKYV